MAFSQLGELNRGTASKEGYLKQISYLQVIWQRLQQDYKNYSSYYGFQTQMFDRIVEGQREYSTSENEQKMMALGSYYKLLLDLDYDTFLIHSRILMDIIAKVVKSLLRDQNIPDRFFNSQKEWLFKDKKPYKNQAYEKLIKEETDWFDLSLKVSRDTMLVHVPLSKMKNPMTAMKHSKDRFRIMRLDFGAALSIDIGEIRSIKQKYEDRYPGLKAVTDTY